MYLLTLPKIINRRFATDKDIATRVLNKKGEPCEQGDLIEEENKDLIENLFSIMGLQQNTVDELMTAHALRDKLIDHRGKTKIKLENDEQKLLRKMISPEDGKFHKDIGMFPNFAPLVEAVKDMEKLS